MSQKDPKGYTSKPLSFNRQMVIASIAGNKRPAIHCVTELDVTRPRSIFRKHLEATGEKLSFTAYLVKCLAHTLQKHPEFNAFIQGRKIILLEDITVSVLIEKTIDGEKVPEPIGIKSADQKPYRQIHDEIRQAQSTSSDRLGKLSNITWIRYMPRFLMKLFVRLADRNITMAKKYGKVAITAIGMHTPSSTWFIPHGTATVLLTVGNISEKISRVNNKYAAREILHLTASFDHELIDGAPAGRFMKQFSKTVESGRLLEL
jgi:pyruvate/2-oxoglutarate dehydrogenase complex dihydrolipoamide acyltransferase (E2) component